MEQAKQQSLYEFYLGLSIMFLCLCMVNAKKIILLSNDVYIAMSGIIFPLTFLCVMVINEVYGHKQCGKAITIILICQLIFITTLWWSALVPAPVVSPEQLILNNAYHTIFAHYGQVVLGGMLGVGFAFYFFSAAHSFLKVKICSSNIYLRFSLSITLSKAIFVIIAYFFNFYGVLNFSDLVKICFYTWMAKVLISLVLIVLAIPIINYTKRREKIDIYDLNVRYSPIYLYSSKSQGMNLFADGRLAS